MKSFKRGTPEFGLLLGLALVIVAALMMVVGFWRVLALVALFAVGYFFGAVEDKESFLKTVVGKVVPEKKTETVDPCPTAAVRSESENGNAKEETEEEI